MFGLSRTLTLSPPVFVTVNFRIVGVGVGVGDVGAPVAVGDGVDEGDAPAGAESDACVE
jgi:hypothetical protein